MTEDSRGEPEDADPAISPLQTGNPAVDDALAGLADLASAPVADHHDRLAQAHAVLHEALDPPDEDQSDQAEPA
ncbi:MAG TPA: hypothetical protein VNC63_10480 [Propionibacteriaceae bacterium]|nr:hypothetical protein [Propionibacteriaceae bacterium]